MKNVVYMQVTTDQYALPVAFADTTVELARIVGVTPNAIRRSLKRAGKNGYGKYIKVIVEDAE